ncbi:hypothetical protein CR513_57111, partial [Mucuna pruriens]
MKEQNKKVNKKNEKNKRKESNLEKKKVKEFLYKNVQDVFSDEVFSGLPLIRRIEHHIDFIPMATLLNKLAYRSNLNETKEIQKQVNDNRSTYRNKLAAVHSTTNCSPFEVIYSFNPLTPLNLLMFPMNKQVHQDGKKKKARYVGQLYEKVKQTNNGCKKVSFEPDD